MPSKKKKTYLRTLSQLGLTPPSVATLGHQQLGHLSWALDPLPPITSSAIAEIDDGPNGTSTLY